MTNKDKNHFITEISEEDFRKLNLVVYEQKMVDFKDQNAIYKQLCWVKTDLNKILDENIAYCIEQGYEHDLDYLKEPVTIAVHVANGPEPEDYYWDKFMNRYTGPATYQFAMGFKHIYVTRDYFEAHEDYWRVKKNETKALYRIHLDPKHLEKFVLKHKTEKAYFYEDHGPGHEHYIEKNFCLDEKNGIWEAKSTVEVKKEGRTMSFSPISLKEAQKLIDESHTYSIKC